MKTILTGIAAAIVIALIAGFGLNSIPNDSQSAFATAHVRL
jgi:hypothetical protein